MSVSDFPISLKSTIDKIAFGLAVMNSVTYVDLADTVETAKLFKTEDTAIVMDFNTLEEDPNDPLYAGSFEIGVRTVNDPANYQLLRLLGLVKSMFPKGDRVMVYDSSEAVESGAKGVILLGDALTMPQHFDAASSMRLINVKFKAQRFLA